jgi:peptidoglycan/xylan/chitin deacetylase (PgdA/CDA1 family)
MTGLTNEQVFAELYFSKKAIKEVTGVTVRCWRPPYGDVDDRVRYIASKLDMRTVVCVRNRLSSVFSHGPDIILPGWRSWNEDTDDWNWSNVGMAAVRANYQGILDDQTAGKFDRSGTIVLTHEL